MPVIIKGPYSMFGLEESMQEEAREFTCICKSLKGELYAIKAKKFINLIESPESWEFIDMARELEGALFKNR